MPAAIGFLVSVCAGAASVVAGVAASIAMAVGAAVAAIASALAPIAGLVVNTLGGLVDAIGSALTAFANNILSPIAEVIKGIAGQINTVAQGISDKLTAAINGLKAAISAELEPILGPIRDTLTIIKETVDAIKAPIEAILGPLESIRETISSITTLAVLEPLLTGTSSIARLLGFIADEKGENTAAAIAELLKTITSVTVSTIDKVDTEFKLLGATIDTMDETLKRSFDEKLELAKTTLLSMVTPRMDMLGDRQLKVVRDIARLSRHVEDRAWFTFMLARALP